MKKVDDFMPRYVSTVFIMALAVVFAFVIQNWRTRYFDYQCGKCDGKFSLAAWTAVLSLHIMGNKYVKCPKCGKWCWASPILKE